MTPDAAGVVAQVDVGLLIALAVDARSPKGNAKTQRDGTPNNDNGAVNKSNDDASGKYAWLYLIGIFAIVISLSVTLASVAYNKPLSGLSQHIVIDAFAVGLFPLIVSAYERLGPEITTSFEKVAVMAISLALAIWFIVWAYSFVPGGFFA